MASILRVSLRLRETRPRRSHPTSIAARLARRGQPTSSAPRARAQSAPPPSSEASELLRDAPCVTCALCDAPSALRRRPTRDEAESRGAARRWRADLARARAGAPLLRSKPSRRCAWRMAPAARRACTQVHQCRQVFLGTRQACSCRLRAERGRRRVCRPLCAAAFEHSLGRARARPRCAEAGCNCALCE